MNDNKVNTTITDTAIETKEQKQKRDFMNLFTTILVMVGAVFFLVSVCVAVVKIQKDKEMVAAPTGEMMLNSITLYGIENVAPFDIIEDAAVYRARTDREGDQYTKLALALADYSEAAFFEYACRYVNDEEGAAYYASVCKDSRSNMTIESFADFIDMNYEAFMKR